MVLFDPTPGVLYATPIPLGLRWPIPPHLGRLPTHEEYGVAGTCEAELRENRCGRRGDHVGVHEDRERGVWWISF